MLAQPTGTNAEAFRMLRTNVAFASLEDTNMRTILVTSAVEKEGKSTTAANLAIAEARAGRRVALVDLDLRVPFIDRFFGLTHANGVTDVALGNTTLEAALTRIDLDTGKSANGRTGLPESNGNAPEHGLLDVRRRPQPDPGRVRRQPPTRRHPPSATRAVRPRDHRHAPDASCRRRDDDVNQSRRPPDRRPTQRHPPPNALRAAAPARNRSRSEARLRGHRLPRRSERRLRLRLRLPGGYGYSEPKPRTNRPAPQLPPSLPSGRRPRPSDSESGRATCPWEGPTLRPQALRLIP